MRVERVGPATVAALLAMVVSGCAVGPDYERPAVETPKSFRGDAQPSPESIADVPWWKLFGDPRLVELLTRATREAYDLRIAAARVEAYRQGYRAAQWALAPTFGVNLGAGYAQGLPNIPSVFPPVPVTGSWVGLLDMSWEIDVWGRLRRAREAAKNDWLATEADRRGVYVSLVADVATLYFRLATLDRQAEYARGAIQARQGTYELFRQRLAGGVGNDLEVARAEANVRDAEARTVVIDRATKIAENALSFLLARPPEGIDRRAKLADLGAPPAVPPGLPSALLERRPDVSSAEHIVMSASARVGVAVADYFPRFDLTGFLGGVSNDLTKLNQSGSTDALYMGRGVFSWTLPFLGGERIRARSDAAWAQLEGARVAYVRAATNAFREVADALVVIQALRDQRAAQEAQVTALERAEATARSRYQGGVANYLDVLTTQEQLFAAQLALADSIGEQLIAVATLYRSLGGGWPRNDAKAENHGDEGERR